MIKRLSALLAVLTLSLLWPASAQAVSNRAPDPNDFNPVMNTYYIEASRNGPTNGLDAPVATVVLYFQNPSGTLTINNGRGQCGEADGLDATNTQFSLYRGTNPTGAYYSTAWDPRPESTLSCGSSSFALSGLPAVTVGDQTYYAATLSAENLTADSNNGFQVSISAGGIVSYYSQSGNKFALQERSQPYGSEANFILRFGTDCRITSNQTVNLRWFDDDYGNSNQSDDLRFRLIEETPAGGTNTIISTAASVAMFTGDNSSGARSFTAKPNHKYRWEWFNVTRENGIQFQLPYNSIFYNATCQSFWRYQSSVPSVVDNTPPTNSVKPGERITPSVRVVNNPATSPEGPGPNYAYRVRPATNAAWVDFFPGYIAGNVNFSNPGGKTFQHSNRGGLAAGASRTDTPAPYLLNNNAVHGQQICFDSRVSPVAGESGGPVTSPGWSAYGADRCITVYNLRYNLSASVSVPPGFTTASVGETVTVTYRMCNTAALPGAATGGVAPDIDITYGTSAGVVGSVSNEDIARGGASCWQTTENVTVSGALGSEFCVDVTTGGGQKQGYSDGTNRSGTAEAEACVTISSGPYFTVANGSAFSGLTIGDGSMVSEPLVPSEALISSTYSGATGVGGVADFAALALGSISGFGSGGSPTSDALKFTSTLPGFYDGVGAQQADLYVDYNDVFNDTLDQHRTITTGSPNVEALAGGAVIIGANYFNEDPDAVIFKYDGDLQLGRTGDPIDFGAAGVNKRIVIIVSGNVRIGEDIGVYNSAGYGSLNDIDNIAVIAEGNITVSPDVSRMDGFYLAKGNFISCDSSEDHSNSPPALLASDVCSEQLRVNGAVIANEYQLKRTNGSADGANGSTDPAEVFVNSPELYLAPMPNAGGGDPSRDQSLPRIGDLLDLPPLF